MRRDTGTGNTGKVFDLGFNKKISLDSASKNLSQVGKGETFLGKVPKHLRKVYARIERMKEAKEGIIKEHCSEEAFRGVLSSILSGCNDSPYCSACNMYTRAIDLGEAYLQAELRAKFNISAQLADVVIRRDWNAYSEATNRANRGRKRETSVDMPDISGILSVLGMLGTFSPSQGGNSLGRRSRRT